LKNNNEFYLDIKSKCEVDGRYDFPKIASLLEKEFNVILENDRKGKFKEVNDLFYKHMENGTNLSRLKIYIAQLLSCSEKKDEMEKEIAEFKKVRKNIGSIITTNYDNFIEEVFGFKPLIGNDILLSNPYGAVYKIHGCISSPSKIILTKEDYNKFHKKYELIRAQLLSIFIHNPIIFMGYKIGDDNIKSILKTVFTYVERNSETAKRIRNNFLLVEYKKDSKSHEICEHDIDMEGFSNIRINKVKTDDFMEIYQSLSALTLPISAMDIRKVQNIVKEIYTGGNIKVKITEDLDSLDNRDKILAIGSKKTLKYHYETQAEMISNYFEIIDESNFQILLLINKYKIQKAQYFPIFGFSKICQEIEKVEILKKQQKNNIDSSLKSISGTCKTTHSRIEDILNDSKITNSNKSNAILWSILNDKFSLDKVEEHLRNEIDIHLRDVKANTKSEVKPKLDTGLRKLLCAYDLKKYEN